MNYLVYSFTNSKRWDQNVRKGAYVPVYSPNQNLMKCKK